MSTDESIALGAEAIARVQRQHDRRLVDGPTNEDLARAAIEAHEAAKGESGALAKVRDVVRDALANADDSGVGWDAEISASELLAIIEGDGPQSPAPDPSESEREALTDPQLALLTEAAAYYETVLEDDERNRDIATLGRAMRHVRAGLRRHPAPAPVVVETVEELQDMPVGTRLLTSPIADDLDGHCILVKRNYWLDNGHTLPKDIVRDWWFPMTVLTPATSATVSAEQVEAGADAVCDAHPHDGGGSTVVWEDAVDDFKTALRAAGLTVEEES